jgi:formate hydrogenlyase subunit 4
MSIDFIIGYLLGSLFGVYLAVVGLIVGSAFFAISSSRKILKAIDRAEYCYFYIGY